MARSAPIFTPPGVKNTRIVEQTKRQAKSNSVYDRDWRGLRDAVLQDEPLCRDCWSKDQIATAASMVHHNLSVHDRPDLRLEISNCVPLCQYHHILRHIADYRE